MKTVFFGPFIGEFGWELLFWQGWVRKVCKGEFKNYRKIASSIPGREPFYPYVDEFWPIPDEFRDLKISAHGYYADGWREGYPGFQALEYQTKSAIKQLVRLKRPRRVWVEKPVQTDNIEKRAYAMLEVFKQKLPEDTVYFVPWQWNRYKPQQIEFGLRLQDNVLPRSDMELIRKIDFEYQQFEYLMPTPHGEDAFHDILKEDKKLIGVFPRYRLIRRADKNWREDKYEQLVRRLQMNFPENAVAIFGEPGGAYFADGVPNGCVDLINVSPDRRMDIQIAALKHCVFSVGGMSGAVLVALASACPTLIWGLPEQHPRYYRENFMGTKMIYHAHVDPPVDLVLELVQALLGVMKGN